MIENSGETESTGKKVPTVKIDGNVVTPSDYLDITAGDHSFYTDSDGQIVAEGNVNFYKIPFDGHYKSIYMKDTEQWFISSDGGGSFKILETDNYVGLEFNNIEEDLD